MHNYRKKLQINNAKLCCLNFLSLVVFELGGAGPPGYAYGACAWQVSHSSSIRDGRGGVQDTKVEAKDVLEDSISMRYVLLFFFFRTSHSRQGPDSDASMRDSKSKSKKKGTLRNYAPRSFHNQRKQVSKILMIIADSKLDLAPQDAFLFFETFRAKISSNDIEHITTEFTITRNVRPSHFIWEE